MTSLTCVVEGFSFSTPGVSSEELAVRLLELHVQGQHISGGGGHSRAKGEKTKRPEASCDMSEED